MRVHATTAYDAEAACWYVQHSSFDGRKPARPGAARRLLEAGALGEIHQTGVDHKQNRIHRSLLEAEDEDEVTVTVLKGTCWVRSGPQMSHMEHVQDARDMAEHRWMCCPGGELFKCFATARTASTPNIGA